MESAGILFKRKSLKHRLKSLRRYVKRDSQMDYSMDNISEEKSESYTMTTHVLKEDIKSKLHYSIRCGRLEEHIKQMEPEFQEELFLSAPLPTKNLAFLWASYVNRLDYMKVLKQQGADVNTLYEGDNFNALHLCALNDSLECCKWLLSQGCVFRKTATDMTPLEYAAFGDAQQVLEYLMEIRNDISYTIMNSAVYANSVKCVKFLMSRKVGVNLCDREGMAPLHIACDHNNVQCLSYLLEHPKIIINAKTRDKRGCSALHLAAENGHHECVRILLEHKANVNELNNKNETPLHLACKMQHPDCVDLLLRHQANVNVKDNDERTPIHGAVSKSRLAFPIVQLLVKWAANVNSSDR